MFDMSWGEVMLIGGVALIVIGPKELPRALRTVGQVTAKLKRMSAEFVSQFNEAMREADLEDAKRDVEGLNRTVSSTLNAGFNPIQTIRDELRTSVESAGAKPSPDALADATAKLEAEREDAALHAGDPDVLPPPRTPPAAALPPAPEAAPELAPPAPESRTAP